MKRYSVWRTVLEILTIIGYIAVSMIILTYLLQSVPFDKIILGAITALIGAIELIEFFTLKHLVKLKNIPLLIVGALELVFGLILSFLNIDLFLTCVVLGWFEIGFSVIKISNFVFNIPQSPIINIIIIILSVVMIVFGILLVVNIETILNSFMLFNCISLLLMAIIYLIEVIVRHSRNN